MSDRHTSRTALGTAYMRAAHQLLDAPPRILEDPLAVTVLGAGFSNVEFLTPAEAEARYFRQRPQDLPVPTRTNIVCAVR
jgi:O-methyltransferase involved in polyketide biosynthesis